MDEKLFKNDIEKPDIKAYEGNAVLFNKTYVQIKTGRTCHPSDFGFFFIYQIKRHNQSAVKIRLLLLFMHLSLIIKIHCCLHVSDDLSMSYWKTFFDKGYIYFYIMLTYDIKMSFYDLEIAQIYVSHCRRRIYMK